MGLLIDGQWHDQWYDTKTSNGEFIREDAQFRHWITEDGSAGPSGEAGFKAEADRYHLYVSLACPWAHRTLIFRELKSLQNLVTVSVVHPHMLDKGWTYAQDFTGTTGDQLYGSDYHYQIYTRDTPSYSGRVTVPVLWDKQQERIVNNESSEIIRMLNSAFNKLTNNELDFYPEELRTEIDEVNQQVYKTINNGVYRAGFATSQSAYEHAYNTLFDNLDELDQRLATQRYLVGNRITEADWRLMTSLVRFDAVYVGHFKCNRQRIADYPHLSAYLRELYQYPGVKNTVNFDHIKEHYYYSHHMINPTRVVPVGPELDLDLAHGREVI